MAWPPLSLYLDPRSSEEAHASPFTKSANIPVVELPDRLAELPPKPLPVAIADCDHAWEAHAFLRAGGRRTVPVTPIPAERYSIGRLWEPNDWLAVHKGPVGRALDLGCGAGREATYLAANGFEIWAVDLLPEAIESARDLVQRFAPRAVVHLGLHDFDTYEPEGKFDLVYATMSLPHDLFVRAYEWLQPGGRLILEAYTASYQSRFGKPRDARRTLCPSRLHEAKGYQIQHWAQTHRGTVRLLAVRDRN